MSELPSLFDAKGVFVPLDDATLATLSEIHATAYLVVESACGELKAADDAVALSQERLTACIADKRAADEFVEKFFPYNSDVAFHDLWRENFGRR